MSTSLQQVTSEEYKYGFVTDIESDSVAAGLNEDVIRFISEKKGEPEWLLEFRLKAYRHWLTLTEPAWANVTYQRPDFQKIVYYSAPKAKSPKFQSLDQVDPELLMREGSRVRARAAAPVNPRCSSNISPICFSMVCSGLSEVIGSWNTMVMSSPRTRRISLSVSCKRSLP